MKFFVRYVLAYFVVALSLLAWVTYSGKTAGYSGSTLIAVCVFALWLLVYHPVVLWLDYRRIARLVAQLRAGELQEKLDPDRVRESVRHLVVEYCDVPDFIAMLLVRRLITDEMVVQIGARLRARNHQNA